MKLAFWRKKKGQIQGVDFALAMIIFMIIFAEVIVLSLSFLQPKYQNLEDRAFETKIDQISDAFFSSTGYPSDWEYDYNTAFSSFGLRSIGSSNLDANKISRINPQSLYRLSYESLIGNISLERDFGFQMHLNSLFDVNGTLSLTQPTATIDILTSIGNCVVWSFVIAPDSTILYTNRAVTDVIGDFSDSFSIGSGTLPNGVYTLVIFAKSSEGHYAIAIDDVVLGAESDLGLKLIVQENQTSNSIASVNTENIGSLSSLSALILYPYPIGGEIYGNESATTSSPNSLVSFNLRIPTNGTSVVLLTGETIPGNFSRKHFLFPTQLNNKFDTIYGEENLPVNKEIVKVEKLVNIRECIFKVVLYVWPE